MNDKGADQSVGMYRLVCAFVVLNPPDRFSRVEIMICNGTIIHCLFIRIILLLNTNFVNNTGFKEIPLSVASDLCLHCHCTIS